MLTNSPDLTAREMAARQAEEKAHAEADFAWTLCVATGIVAIIVISILLTGCDHEVPIGTDGTVDVSAEG